MSTLFIFSVATTLATMSLLIFTVLRQRFLLVKPTVWIIAYFHLQIQWAATVNAPTIEMEMLYPWHFFVLSQLFPLISLLLTQYTFRNTSKQLWDRLGQPLVKTPALNSVEYGFLFGLWALILIIYFSVVPPTSSGLWVLLTSRDYLTSAFAREDSLKLLDNAFVKYAYAYNAGFLALFLGVITTVSAIESLKRRQAFVFVAKGILFLAILTSVALAGARSPAAVVVMAAIGAVWIRSGAPFKPVRIATAAFVVLSIPTLFTMFRSSDPFTYETFITHFNETILARAFYVPMHTGELWCRYVQENGYWGIGGIPKLALLFGGEPVNVANIMARVIFVDSPVESALVNTSYVFSYYSYFGLPIFPVLIALLLVLDVILPFFNRVPDAYLLPGIIALNTGCLSLSNSDYTTLFLSNGYVPGPLTIAIMMVLFRPSIYTLKPNTWLSPVDSAAAVHDAPPMQ